MDFHFLDQELISYCYSSCSCSCCCCCWGDCFKKSPQGSVASNWIGIKFGRIVPNPQVNNWICCYASIDESDFGYGVILSSIKMATMTLFHAENCCHLVIEHDASDWHSSSLRQFLICCTFVLVTITY